MDNQHVINFTEDGKVTTLHVDSIDAILSEELGNKSVNRATDIVYNETTQSWDIGLILGGRTIFVTPLKGFSSYEGARQVEVFMINAFYERSGSTNLENMTIFDVTKAVNKFPELKKVQI